MASLVEGTNPNTISSSHDDSNPTLPFDLIPQILSRLPVKLLLRFRCVCKFWNSLISDPKFARVHFNLSTTRNLHCVTYEEPSFQAILNSYSLPSIFTDTNYNFTQLEFPLDTHYIVGSCDGILCIADQHNFNRFVVLWNPCIRKFKKSSPFENPPYSALVRYGFGYHHVSHDYKVVVLYNPYIEGTPTKVMIYSLSTDSWKSIQMFPCGNIFGYVVESGIYVNGSISWLAYPERTVFRRGPFFILSFDLGKDSYHKILGPDLWVDAHSPKLCALRDCLCIISSDFDVWVMKEYGIKESWIKLFNVSFLRGPNIYTRLANVLYIFQDQVLLVFDSSEMKYILYNFKNDTFNVITMLQDYPEVCVESLISPCS